MDIKLSRFLLLLFIAVSTSYGQLTLKAQLDMAGIKGDVTFTQADLTGSAVNYNFTLEGATNGVTWELRESWVDYTVRDKCAALGARYNTNLGDTLASGTDSGAFPVSYITDLKLLLGRSILLTVPNGDKACATFKKNVPYVTAYVRLQNADTSGEVWLRQAEGERTEIVADVFDSRTASSVRHDWKIYTGTGNDCKTMSVFNPTSPGAGACGVSNQAACAIGDMSGRHGQLQVGQTKGSSREFFHDVNLGLSGENSVLNKFLVILDSESNVISCGVIKEIKEKNVKAVFNVDNVRGYIKFTQMSPFDATNIYRSMFGFDNIAGGYHVHVFPVPSHVGVSEQLCSVDNVGGHWNPFNKPFPATGLTTDMYEVGDISGKFGSLADQDSMTGAKKDYNLPLFGEFSIVGRSFVVHKNMPSQGNPRWMCSNIELEGETTYAVATFKTSVIGAVLFAQASNDPLGDTWISGFLNYADGTMSATSGHMWMVHQNMVEDSCSSVGGMYNPFNASKQTDYNTQCSSSNSLRCQVGDLTKLTAALKIRTTNKLAENFFVTSQNIPLSGSGSIIGRSAVIHAANMNGNVLGCTNIYHLRPRDAILDSWSNDVRGYMKFSQQVSYISSPTIVTVNVTGLNNIAGKYHVHIYPVPPNSSSPCSGASVSDHYNPYRFDPKRSPAPGTGTYDKYEAGDISGKKGLMANMMEYSTSYTDNMLNLFGPRSIIGRSVVIHRMEDGSRWSCGNIRENTDMTGGRLHAATADFMENGLKGHVMLSQYSYPDGSMSDTSVYIYVNNVNNKTTNGHKISIGSMPAYKDRKSSTDRCASTSTTFNPYGVHTTTGYEECGMMNPLRCMAGDITGKHKPYDIGAGKMLVTDVNLPLAGRHSVIGLPIVIHAANGGQGKLACSNIKADVAVKSDVIVDMATGNMLTKMAEYYSTYLNTDLSNVAVYKTDSDDGCGRFDVYFMGPERQSLKTRFDSAVTNNRLSQYQSTVCSADTARMSLLLLAVLYFSKTVLL